MKELEELIENSDLPQIKKNMAIGFVNSARDAREDSKADRNLIEKTTSCKYFDVVISTDDFIVYQSTGKSELDVKFPFRFIALKDNEWRGNSTVYETLDQAILGYLGYKYDGLNSQFFRFAARMLGIE